MSLNNMFCAIHRRLGKLNIFSSNVQAVYKTADAVIAAKLRIIIKMNQTFRFTTIYEVEHLIC